MDKVKTVIDVVNEFEGVIPEHLVGKDGWTYHSLPLKENTGISFNDDFVCTFVELNACVGELSKAEWMSKPKPVYTKEMCDNGDLPSIGADCLAKRCHESDSGWKTCFVIGKDKTGHYLVFEYGGELEQVNIDNGTFVFKPLTPPIKLEDGKAYSFDSESVGSCGIYSDEYNLFHYIGNEVVMVDDCTNIKLLGVIDG